MKKIKDKKQQKNKKDKKQQKNKKLNPSKWIFFIHLII